MIDLTNVHWKPNRFGGSESKWTIEFDGKLYMVKFPDPNRSENRTQLSYINNHFSEHIGCEIFHILGIPAQNTFLGRGTPPNSTREKIAVVCEIFCQNDTGCLIEFSKFLLHETDSQKRNKTTIEDVMSVIETDVTIKNKEQVENFFWDMFVVDTLIGNTDRHLDNWGMIEAKDGTLSPAPIYDCGSAFSPLKSAEEKLYLLNNPTLLKNLEYNLCSVYRYRGQRIRYHEIFRNMPEGLSAAVTRIVPRIQATSHQMFNFIDQVEGLSDIARTYIKQSLLMRRDQILVPALNKCQALEKPTNHSCRER